jgi:thiaminase
MQTQAQKQWLVELGAEARKLVAAVDARPDARGFLDGTVEVEGYIHYLVQTYHYARWSTPILGEGGERLKKLGWHPELAELLIQKAREERGHDKWLLADLKKLGVSADRVEEAARCPAVEAYRGWNFFTSRSGVPSAVLGTAYVLEYLSQTRAGVWAERLKTLSTIPNIGDAVTFLHHHGELDEGHVAEMDRIFEQLTDPEEQEAILFSARVARCVYPRIFREGDDAGAPPAT